MDSQDPKQNRPPEVIPATLELRSAPSLGYTMFVGPGGLRPGWRIFLYVGMGVGIFSLLSSLEHLIPGRGAGALWQQMYIQFVLATAAMVPAVIMARIEKRQFGIYGLPVACAFDKWFWIGLAWGLIALSTLMVLMRGVGVFSFGHFALHGERIFKFAGFWGVLFILVGFFEEFSFRGYAQFTLTQGIGFWPAACLLSFIFGLLHLIGNVGENVLGSLCAAMIGLFFCFTLKRTGTLWFAVGMHASWDWGESYLYSVPDSGGMATGHLLNSSFHGSRWLTGGSVGPEGSVLVFVVIGIAWLLFDRMYPAVAERHSQGQMNTPAPTL